MNTMFCVILANNGRSVREKKGVICCKNPLYPQDCVYNTKSDNGDLWYH